MFFTASDLLKQRKILIRRFALAHVWRVKISVGQLVTGFNLLVILLLSSESWDRLELLNILLLICLVIARKIISLVSNLETVCSTVLGLFADVVICLVEIVTSCEIICTLIRERHSSKALVQRDCLVVTSHLGVICTHSFRSLWSVCRVAQGLALLNLLVNDRKVALKILSVLLIKRRHSKLLMGQSLLFATGRSVTVVCRCSEVNFLLLLLTRVTSCKLVVSGEINWLYVTKVASLF